MLPRIVPYLLIVLSSLRSVRLSVSLLLVNSLFVIASPFDAHPSSTEPSTDPGSGAPGEQVARAQTGARTVLELIKEEESVSIATGLGREQPISQAPSNVYVITDEDIRHSGATDIPTVLRRIPGLEVMQMTGADFNVSVRGNNQLPSNKLLALPEIVWVTDRSCAMLGASKGGAERCGTSNSIKPCWGCRLRGPWPTWS